MMTADSDNNLFGRTLNPNKLSLTAGGSTGGEGALLKIRGSILGVGTDIAGSVRIPSYCNGIFGFKPTAGRIPFAGKVPPGRIGAPSSILPSIGPEGHSVRDMELWMKTVIDSNPWDIDPNAINIPWRTVEPYTRPLRLGMLTEDPSRKLHPTVLRTMKSAASALDKAGHNIVSLDGKVPSLWESTVLSWKYFSLDPADTPAKILAEVDEPLVTSIPTTYMDEIPQGWTPSIDDVFEMNMQRFKVVHVYHKLIMENELDGFIMPAYQATAVPHDTFGVPIYTVLPNLINYPAGVIPYLKADKKEDAAFVRASTEYEPPCEFVVLVISVKSDSCDRQCGRCRGRTMWSADSWPTDEGRRNT
jgi:amidase